MFIYNMKGILVKKGIVNKEFKGEGENGDLLKQRRAGSRLYNIYYKPGCNMQTYSEAEEIGNNNISAYFN